MIMPLTDEESVWMQRAGNDLVPTPKERTTGVKPPKGRKFYTMAGACAMLAAETGLCVAYDDPNRPKICGEFDAGGEGCTYIRDARLPGTGGRVPLPMPAVLPDTAHPPLAA